MKHFHIGAVSGVIAATTNGVLFAFHNDAANVMHIQRVRARFNVITEPDAAQELAIELALAAFGDDYTGGQNLSDPATAADYAIRNRNLDKLRVLQSAWRPASSLASGNVRIASTGSLSAGASPATVDAHGFAWIGDYFSLTATIGQPVLDLIWQSPTLGQDYERPGDGCIPLEQDRGFVVQTSAALGAGFTGRLAVEVDWIET
jgi:hypothetical protein